MDVFERLNRKFGGWYDGLFGGAESRILRPREILRRIVAAMEDNRREGLDGRTYVPNVYSLQIVVDSDDERCYLRTFLSAEDLAESVARIAEEREYLIRGALVFNVQEGARPAAATADRVQIRCRFDSTAGTAPVSAAARSSVEIAPPMEPEPDEPGTVAAVNALPTLASLVVRGADGHLQDVFPLTARGARIGRGRTLGNDILLTGDGMISKGHARVVYEGGGFSVYDDGSTNGTWLRGERLQSGRGYPLRSGDEVRLGQTIMLFRLASSASNAPAPPAVTARAASPSPDTGGERGRGDSVGSAAALAAPASGSNGVYRLISAEGEPIALASNMSVGRALTSDLIVIGNGVGSQHARLTVRGDTLFVEDLRSPGGTAVNGEKIPVEFPVALYEGDRIAFGDVPFHLTRAPEDRRGAERF